MNTSGMCGNSVRYVTSQPKERTNMVASFGAQNRKKKKKKESTFDAHILIEQSYKAYKWKLNIFDVFMSSSARGPH